MMTQRSEIKPSLKLWSFQAKTVFLFARFPQIAAPIVFPQG